MTIKALNEFLHFIMNNQNLTSAQRNIRDALLAEDMMHISAIKKENNALVQANNIPSDLA